MYNSQEVIDDDSEIAIARPFQTDVQGQITFFHSTENARAMPLFLQELGDDFEEHYKQSMKRAGVDISKKEIQIVKSVRYDEDKDDWVYKKPQIGDKMQAAASDLLHHLQEPLRCCPLPSNEPAEQISHHKEEKVSHAWKFVGKRPAVEEWLAGVGTTELVPVDRKPEEPIPDVQLPSQTHHNPVGRARIPMATAGQVPRIERAGSLSSSSSEDDDDDDKLDVNQILHIRAKPQPVLQVSKVGPREITPDTQPLIEVIHATQEDIAESQKLSSHAVSSVAIGHHGPTRTASPATSRPAEKLDRPRDYVQVDSFGLTGRAAAQAQWELVGGPQIPAARELKLSRSPSMERSPSVTRPQVILRHPYSDGYIMPDPGPLEPWATRIVPDAPVQPHESPKQFLESEWPKPRRTKEVSTKEQAPTLRKENVRPDSDQEQEEDLIAFSESSEYYSAQSLSPASDAIPKERLADEPSSTVEQRHYTMRQKAGRKRKNAGKETTKKTLPILAANQGSASSNFSRPAPPPATPVVSRVKDEKKGSAPLNITQPVRPSATPTLSSVKASQRFESAIEWTIGILPFADFLKDFSTKNLQDDLKYSRVLIQFGTFLSPCESKEALPSHALLLQALERALRSKASLDFVPQLLRPKECAAIYDEVLQCLDPGSVHDLPPQKMAIRAELTTHDSQHLALEAEWNADFGVVARSTVVLHNKRSVLCPQYLWDCQLSSYQEVGQPRRGIDARLLDFVSSIRVKEHMQGLSDTKILTANIPQVGSIHAFKIHTMALIKEYSAVLRESSDDDISRGAAQGFESHWTTRQTLIMTIQTQTSGTFQAIADCEEQLEMDGKSFWQSYLTTYVPSTVDDGYDWSWYENVGKRLIDCMNKLYFGKRQSQTKRPATKKPIPFW